MPWDHCGQRLLDDVGQCPSCGAPKTAWSTRYKRTRVLAIGGKFEGDPGGQADTLLTAAEDGAPFCEECQEEPEEEGEELEETPAGEGPTPEEQDAAAAAQADTLATASETGAPFCEECQAEEEEAEDGEETA